MQGKTKSYRQHNQGCKPSTRKDIQSKIPKIES